MLICTIMIIIRLGLFAVSYACFKIFVVNVLTGIHIYGDRAPRKRIYANKKEEFFFFICYIIILFIVVFVLDGTKSMGNAFLCGLIAGVACSLLDLDFRR